MASVWQLCAVCLPLVIGLTTQNVVITSALTHTVTDEDTGRHGHVVGVVAMVMMMMVVLMIGERMVMLMVVTIKVMVMVVMLLMTVMMMLEMMMLMIMVVIIMMMMMIMLIVVMMVVVMMMVVMLMMMMLLMSDDSVDLNMKIQIFMKCFSSGDDVVFQGLWCCGFKHTDKHKSMVVRMMVMLHQ